MHKRGTVHSRHHGLRANDQRSLIVGKFVKGLIYGVICALVVISVIAFMNMKMGKPLPAPKLSADMTNAISGYKTAFEKAGYAAQFTVNNNYCKMSSGNSITAYNKCMNDVLASLSAAKTGNIISRAIGTAKSKLPAPAAPTQKLMLVSQKKMSQIDVECKAVQSLPNDIFDCMKTLMRFECNSKNIGRTARLALITGIPSSSKPNPTKS